MLRVRVCLRTRLWAPSIPPQMPWKVLLLACSPSRCLGAWQALRQRLEAAGQLAPADVEAVWRHACHHAAEMVLEGIARAGAGARCTVMGRSAMSLDLQVLQRGIAQVRVALNVLHALLCAWRPWSGPNPEQACRLRYWAGS